VSKVRSIKRKQERTVKKLRRTVGAKLASGEFEKCADCMGKGRIPKTATIEREFETAYHTDLETCQTCQGVGAYEKGELDEKALDEAEAVFGDVETAEPDPKTPDREFTEEDLVDYLTDIFLTDTELAGFSNRWERVRAEIELKTRHYPEAVQKGVDVLNSPLGLREWRAAFAHLFRPTKEALR
jgi:hypothetical protein